MQCIFMAGSPKITHKAKVSWADLCFPKTEVGLEVLSLRDTSRVFALGLIWRLFSLSGSLWMAWTCKYLLLDGSYWNFKEGKAGS